MARSFRAIRVSGDKVRVCQLTHNQATSLRKDARIVGQLLNDDDTVVAPSDLDDNPTLLAALADASGMVEAACLQAGRYQISDLQNLTDNSQAFLARLVCDLTLSLLRRRRAYEADDLKEYEQANETLERLRKGELVFTVQADIDAGNPSVDQLYLAKIIPQNLAGISPNATSGLGRRHSSSPAKSTTEPFILSEVNQWRVQLTSMLSRGRLFSPWYSQAVNRPLAVPRPCIRSRASRPPTQAFLCLV